MNIGDALETDDMKTVLFFECPVISYQIESFYEISIWLTNFSTILYTSQTNDFGLWTFKIKTRVTLGKNVNAEMHVYTLFVPIWSEWFRT